MAAGFRERKDYEYGGEEITIKDKLLVKNPRVAVSETAWRKQGRAVKPGETPHAERYAHSHSQYYDVYREDQTRELQKKRIVEPILVDVLAALFTLNRKAKRLRDNAAAYYNSESHGLAGHAKNEKTRIYGLKSQALQYLIAEGRLVLVGYHRVAGGNCAEILEGEGYCFHRPCAPPADGEVKSIKGEIEAKPKGANEPRIKDAYFTVEAYLKDKRKVDVYEWPRRQRDVGSGRSRDDDPDDFDASSVPINDGE